MKKIKVKLKDITILNNGIHNAEWRVLGTWQGWIGRKELERIVECHRTNTVYKKRLIHKIIEK